MAADDMALIVQVKTPHPSWLPEGEVMLRVKRLKPGSGQRSSYRTYDVRVKLAEVLTGEDMYDAAVRKYMHVWRHSSDQGWLRARSARGVWVYVNSDNRELRKELA